MLCIALLHLKLIYRGTQTDPIEIGSTSATGKGKHIMSSCRDVFDFCYDYALSFIVSEFQKLVLSSLALLRRDIDTVMQIVSEKELRTSTPCPLLNTKGLPLHPVDSVAALFQLDVELGSSELKVKMVR